LNIDSPYADLRLVDELRRGNLPRQDRELRETHPAKTAMRARRMAQPLSPSSRTLAGIALILLLIVLWAAFVASLAQVVGAWPVLVQAPFYLIMGIAWIIPLKPLIRWIQTGSARVSSSARD
jgi:hypothetical protein